MAADSRPLRRSLAHGSKWSIICNNILSNSLKCLVQNESKRSTKVSEDGESGVEDSRELHLAVKVAAQERKENCPGLQWGAELFCLLELRLLLLLMFQLLFDSSKKMR